jgi:predicted transcriptional regulator
MSMQTVSFRTESDKVKSLDELAENQQRDRTFILNEAIDQYLELHNRRYQQVLEAIEECDQGLVIPHDEVMAWVESLGTDHPLPMPVPSSEAAK